MHNGATELAAKLEKSLQRSKVFGFSSEDNVWLTVCFTGSVESKPLVCLSGMNRSSVCHDLSFGSVDKLDIVWMDRSVV